jgi:hypothetical protein
MLPALIHVLIVVLVLGLIFGLLWWALSYLPLPAPFAQIARFIVVLIFALILINLFVGPIAPVPGAHSLAGRSLPD